ncbi:MAG: DUF308 domain-containing protein [Bacteroidales bacterium]|nr:DUF308 domain-containing protein [Bacteroidales bacterium]
MDKSTKIWLVISGILLVALGILCIAKPAATLFATAWLIGCFTLFSGISKLVFTFRTERFLPNSGTRMLSSLLQILIGILFLCNNIFVAISIPIVFALWVLVEGVIIFIESFDFKKVGFGYWWLLMILGILVAALGVLGLYNVEVTGNIVAILIGVGIIVMGVAYLLAYSGIHKFEKEVVKFNNSVKDMMQQPEQE